MDEDLFWRVLHADPKLKHVAQTLGGFRVHEGAKTFEGFQQVRDEERKRIYGKRPLPERFVPKTLLSQFARLLKYGSILQKNPRAVIFELLGR
jgi:hypothetical protein